MIGVETNDFQDWRPNPAILEQDRYFGRGQAWAKPRYYIKMKWRLRLQYYGRRKKTAGFMGILRPPGSLQPGVF